MSSSINVVGDRDGWGPKFLAQMDSKEKAICERRRDFDGRAGREGDGWMRFDSAGWTFLCVVSPPPPSSSMSNNKGIL